MGGGFMPGGKAVSSYRLAGSIFDSEFRCTIDLLQTIPVASYPDMLINDEFCTFSERHPFHDVAYIVDRRGHILHGPRFGRSLRDGLDRAWLVPAPETKPDGSIEEFVAPRWVRCVAARKIPSRSERSLSDQASTSTTFLTKSSSETAVPTSAQSIIWRIRRAIRTGAMSHPGRT